MVLVMLGVPEAVEMQAEQEGKVVLVEQEVLEGRVDLESARMWNYTKPFRYIARPFIL